MNIDNVLVNKKTNVGNLDGMDASQYKGLRKARKIRQLEQEWEKESEVGAYATRDIWAMLVKRSPELKRHKDTDMTIPYQVLKRLQGTPELEALRAYTTGDPTVAAIGACNLNKAAIKIAQTINQEVKDRKKKMEEARKKAEEKKKEMKDNRKKENELKKKLDELKKQMEKQPQPPQPQPESESKPQQAQPQPQPGSPNPQPQPQQEQQNQAQQQMEQMEKDIKKAQQAAKRAEKAANKAQQETQQAQAEIEQAIETAAGQMSQEEVGQVIEGVRKETKEDAETLEAMFGKEAGKGAGTEDMAPDESLFALEALEYIKNDGNIKRIAKLAGDMKRIAMKKQKSLSKQTTLRKGVQQGNEIEKLLPTELMQYSKTETRKEFMRKFAEGETLQYKKTAKEKQGYGHMVVCVDVSGSMSSMIGTERAMDWAKAVAFGLYSVAAKQNRRMFVVEFTGSIHASYAVNKNDDSIQKLLRPVSTGGTCFTTALNEGFRIIKEMQAYKKADIIFITDGGDQVPYLEEVKKLKKELKVSISSIQIDSDGRSNPDLEEISDEYIVYTGQGEGFTDIFKIA